jgi:hypothetical protein
MLTVWTKNLKTEEERQNFNNQLYGARPVLSRLYELLNEKEAELGKTERSKGTYANPNWAYLQAHYNGCASMIASIKELITLDQREQ